MNNKRLGTEFEVEFCKLLAGRGYWVHFIAPSPNGGQPFDVIAAKDGKAHAYDCKTSVAVKFPFTRLEENQKLAFERWKKCGNSEPQIAVKYGNSVYLINYSYLKEQGVVNLEREADLFADL